MSGRIGCCVLVAVFVQAAPPLRGQTTAAKGHVDHEGQPLPAGAIARLGSGRFRAGEAPYLVRYTPNGDAIAVAVSRHHEWGATGAIAVFDAAKGTLRWRIAAEVGYSSDLQCDADGKTLHFYSRGVYRALDLSSGKERRRLTVPFTREAHGQLAPAAKRLATRPDPDHVGLFDLNSGRELLRISSGSKDARVEFTSSGPPLALAPDGRTLAIVTAAGMVQGFDCATGAKRFEIRVPLARWDDMRFSVNGRDLFCTGNCDRGWYIVRDCLGKPAVVQLEPTAGNLNMGRAAFTPDGKHVAVGSYREFVALYDVATGKEVRRFATGGMYSALTFSADGGRLLAVNYHGAISQWETATGRLLPASAVPLQILRIDRFADDGKHLRIHTSRPQVVDWKTNRLLHAYSIPPRYANWVLTLSPDGKRLAGRWRYQFAVLDAKTGKEIHLLGSEQSPVPDGTIMPSGKRMLTYGMDPTLKLWEIGARMPTRVLRPPHYPFLLAIAGDDRLLATGTARNLVAPDHDVRIWDLATGKLLQRVPPRNGRAHVLAFSDDGQTLAIAMVDSPRDRFVEVSLIDTRTGRERCMIPVPWHMVSCLQFSPDGRTLAGTDAADGQLRLWEVATGHERHRFAGHRQPIRSIAFSGDGALLAGGSADAPALVWDVYGTCGGKADALQVGSAAERQRLWHELSSPHARVGFLAVRRLVGNPAAAVALIRERLMPAQRIDPKRIAQWLLDLDSDDFDTRQTAYTDLLRRADAVEATLNAELSGKPSLEMKRRLVLILGGIDTPTPERLARWRALEALEQIGTPDAVRLLETLAAGAGEARLTREAGAVLMRLRKR